MKKTAFILWVAVACLQAEDKAPVPTDKNATAVDPAPSEFMKRSNMASSFQGKSFTMGKQDPLGKPGASGFSKEFKTGSSDMLRPALIENKPILTPTVSFDQTFATQEYPITPNTTVRSFGATAIESKSSQYNSKGIARGFDKSYATRDYAGPELTRVKQDMAQINQGLAGIKELPDRSLTVGEVRALLNRDSATHSAPPAGAKTE